jgi:hypothetical protein
MKETTFDLNSLLNLQKNYALDLAAIDDDNKAKYITQLNDKLSTLSNTLDNRSDLSNIIVKQKDIKNILDTENTRLEIKKDQIDDATSGQKRVIHMNKSYVAKYNYSNRITYAIILATIIILALILIKKYLNIIPEFLETILYIIIISGTLIYCLFVLVDIASRDKMDFNKLNLPAPDTSDSSASNRNKNIEKGDLSALSNICKGQDCCDEGSIYDPKMNKCVPQPDSTIPANDSPSVDGVESFKPSQYTQYQKI